MTIQNTTIFRYFSILLPTLFLAAFFWGCSGKTSKIQQPTDKEMKVVVSDKKVSWPVYVDIVVDDELIHRYRILFSFEKVKHPLGRSQYVYASHQTETVSQAEGGFTFPALSIDNYAVCSTTDDSDSTRQWKTDIDFHVYFSDAAIEHHPEVRKWSSDKHIVTYYNDWVDLSNAAFGRHTDNAIKMRNGFDGNRNGWHLPKINFTEIYMLESRKIAVSIYAKPFRIDQP